MTHQTHHERSERKDPLGASWLLARAAMGTAYALLGSCASESSSADTEPNDSGSLSAMPSDTSDVADSASGAGGGGDSMDNPVAGSGGASGSGASSEGGAGGSAEAGSSGNVAGSDATGEGGVAGSNGGASSGGTGGTNPGGAGTSGAGTSDAGTSGAGASGAGGEGPALIPLDDLEVIEHEIPDLMDCENAYPHDPAVDEATGNVYWAGSNENCIGEYNPETGAFAAWPAPTPDSYPHGLDVGSDGWVYYTGQDADRIGRVNPVTGVIEDYAVTATGPHTPVIHAGALWFTAQSGGQFGRFDLESFTANVYEFSSTNFRPYGLWPAPDGSLWVALFGTNRVARIDIEATPPSVEEIILPDSGARPRRIAVDADGVVWYTDYARRMLGKVDPNQDGDARFGEWPTPSGGQPYGITIGPDARVWYNDQDASELVGFDQASEMVVSQLPLELETNGPVRNIDTDRVRRRIWLAISNVGRLGMIQF